MMLILGLTAIAILQVLPVFADYPHIDNIIPWTRTSDNHTILNITITHDTGAPTVSHYVDIVEVNVSGTLHDLPQTPQSTVQFTVQYDMGIVTDRPLVQANAHCTVHSWGGWSNPVEIPEFSVIQLIPIIAIISIAFLLLRPKVSNAKKLQDR